MIRLRPFIFSSFAALTPLLAQNNPGSAPVPAPPLVVPPPGSGESAAAPVPLPGSAPAPAPAPAQPSGPSSAEGVPTAPPHPEKGTPEGTGPSSASEPASAPATAVVAPASSKISYSSCQVEGSYVAITFDDGPHAQHTPRLLDLLKERKVRATFFVVGQNAVEYPELLKRIVAEGHELANHSYSHPILASLGEAGLRDQMEKTSQAVLKATGVTMRLMRPPYGALSEPQRRFVNATYHYRVILWDVDPLDWKHRDAARVQNEICGHAKPGSIILAHDIHKSTVDAMPGTLDTLLGKGFKFVTVSELLAMDRPGAPKPPKSGILEAEGSKKAGSKGSTKDKKATATGIASGSEGKTSSKAVKSSGTEGSASESAESKKGAGSAPKKPESPEEVKQRWLKMFGR